jgi:hypothetical protein
VAGEAKLRLLGAFDMRRGGHRAAQDRKNENAMNASIFPVTELVIAGLTTMVAMRRAVIISSAYSNISGDGKFNAMGLFQS